MKSPTQELIKEWIMHFSQFIPEKSVVLDLGCGNGLYTQLIAKSNSKLIGVDLHYSVDEIWKSLFTYVTADGTGLPFKNESFDFIVTFDVIEHIEQDQLFVNEIKRVLKKGGKCAIGTPNRWRLTNRILKMIGKERKYPLFLGTSPMGLGDIIHVREYTDQDLKSLFSKSGLDIMAIDHLWLGTCLPPFEIGFKKFPKTLNKYSQYLMVTATKL